MASSNERIRWNRVYSSSSFVPDWGPNISLAQRIPELPRGRCLDIASGVGADSLFLAKRGYRVDALEISDVAVEMLRRASYSEGVSDRVHLILGDVRDCPLEGDAYDLVVCFRFMLHDLVPRVIDAMKPGGVLLLKLQTLDHLKYEPAYDRSYCVSPGRLPEMFSDLDLVHYEEVDEPEDAHALLVARKR